MSNTSLLIQRWIMCCKAFSHFFNRELAASGAWGGLFLPYSHSSCSILAPVDLYRTHPWMGFPTVWQKSLHGSPQLGPTSMMHDIPIFLEQFSKVQSIRKNADVKSSHVQERFFLFSSMPSWLSFFKRSFGKEGFPDESSHYSSSSLSSVILRSKVPELPLCSYFCPC